jgi:hypothetical protein
MLPLLSSPFYSFVFCLLCFSYGAVSHKDRQCNQRHTSVHLSRLAVMREASQGRGDLCPPLGLNTRCFLVTEPQSDWRLPRALRSASPTTFYPCELLRSSPNALCVVRQRLEGPEEATPSKRRPAAQARNFLGSPPPVPRLRRDVGASTRLPLFEHRPLRQDPSVEEAPERNE